LQKSNYSPPAPTERAGAVLATGETAVVPDSAGGCRLDQALARLFPEHSRSRLANWTREGHVRVDGRTVEPRHRVWGGERIEISLPDSAHAGDDLPQAIGLTIVHEDDDILVIDKPAGLVVHPGNGNPDGTVVNALLHHAPQVAAVPRAGVVHRLDKDTSGLMVAAKTLEAHTALVRQLQARTVRRDYAALVHGLTPPSGRIEEPIGRDPRARVRMAVVASGKPAATRYRRIEALPGCSLIECSLETGRTHQIRVHMAHAGHPLVGDPVYGLRRRSLGGPLATFARQALHAWRLGLIHPRTGEALQWQVPLAPDLAALLEVVREAAIDAGASGR
jgi:23S rRNA pseudouridine1911/1915/1917 synthase